LAKEKRKLVITPDYNSYHPRTGYTPSITADSDHSVVKISVWYPSVISRKEGAEMAKTMSCRDVGFDCGFVAKGETEEDILLQAAAHARSVHNINEITPEIAEKVKNTIKDEAA
jgi:predicted small metal-binding protein